MKKQKQVRTLLTPTTLEKVVSITGRGRRYKSMEDLALAAVSRSLGHRPPAVANGAGQTADGQGVSYDIPLFQVLRARLAHELASATALGLDDPAEKECEAISPRFPDDNIEFMEKVSKATGLPMSKIVAISIEELLKQEAANA